MALRMEAAESRETSCSPERPPKRMPMRIFFFMSLLSVCQAAVVSGVRMRGGTLLIMFAASLPGGVLFLLKV